MASRAQRAVAKDISNMSENLFILSWDCNGLEACIDVTKKSKEMMFETLKGSDALATFLGKTLNVLVMRAKFNSQRHYEIYTITTTPDIDEENMREMFELNPQGMADLIRERGNKVFSDRAPSKPKIV